MLPLSCPLLSWYEKAQTGALSSQAPRGADNTQHGLGEPPKFNYNFPGGEKEGFMPRDLGCPHLFHQILTIWD